MNGNAEVSLCAGSYMGGGSYRCTTAEELARNFVSPVNGGVGAYVHVSGERIEAAIASGEVWEHLARAVAEQARRRRTDCG